MKRNMKTILMGTVALMAGMGLASAQGMRDVPGSANDRGDSSGSSSQMHGKSEKTETRGQAQSQGHMDRSQAQRGPSDKDAAKGQAKSERSTTGQGASEKDELSKSPSAQNSKGKNADELKSKSSAKPAEKSTTGQAAKDSAKDKADTGKSSASKKDKRSTTGQASKDKNEKSTIGQSSSDTKASPDNKASSDSKQQMNRQSQDPNAAKQNQTTGSATQSNTNGQSNASIRSQAGVQVSSQQVTKIESVMSSRNVPRVDHVSFSIRTGAVVPRDVHFVSVTTYPELIEVFPRYRDYSFFVVEDEIVFVDRGHKIVDVVPMRGHGHVAGSSSTTALAMDLSEREIREIQQVLIQRGHLHGQVTGVFDTRTREALIAFQRKEGFEATGRIDTRTVTALGLEGKVKAKSENQSSSTSSPSDGRSPTTGQGQSGVQKPDQKDTTGQAPVSQQNAAPQTKADDSQKPAEQKGERKGSNAQPAPKDQQSTNGKSAPSRSTTGQGSRERNSQPGMSDQNSSGQNERPRQ
jgi:putative peptidoglycan binding protein